MILDYLKFYSGIAIIDHERSYSYPELLEEINNIKQKLIDLVNPGDVVAIQSDYTFKSIAFLFALYDLKCIIVPIVPTNDEERILKVDISRSKYSIRLFKNDFEIEQNNLKTERTYDTYINLIEKNRPGLVIFSSGTSGAPKVMVHDLQNLIDLFTVPKKQRSIIFLIFLLFDHIGGINTLINTLLSGASAVITADRSPDKILFLIEKFKIQVLPTTPTFLNLLLMNENFSSAKVSSLKLISYGTERMSRSLLSRVRHSFPGAKLLQTFGTSETGILKTVSKDSDSLYFKIEDKNTNCKIENNELFIRSEGNVKQYENWDNSSFLNDGWFATGDIVEQDDEGFIKIIGRKNEVINVGGLKVMPIEVESIINDISGVISCQVYPIENAITGFVVGANIVVDKTKTFDEFKISILRTCALKMEKYKIPKKINFGYKLNYTNRFKIGNFEK